MKQYVLEINIDSDKGFYYSLDNLDVIKTKNNKYKFAASDRADIIGLLNCFLDCLNGTLTGEGITASYIENFKEDIPSIKNFFISDTCTDSFEYEINFGSSSINIKLSSVFDNKKHIIWNNEVHEINQITEI